jgi:hypothetical protein
VIAELDGATLRFEGKEVVFPDAARETVAALASTTGAVTARALPGDLDEASRLVIVRRLIREGFLRTVG